MVQIQQTSGGTVQFTFTNNQHYLNNGVIEWPLNALSMTIDTSDMITFKNAAGDIVITSTLAELGKTKAEMEELYQESFVGGGGMTPEEVENLIDESISGLAVASAVTAEIEAAVSGKSDISSVTAVNDALTAHTANTDIHVTAEQKTEWDNKADVSAITAAVSGKVDTSALTANYYDKDDVDASFEVVAYSLIELNTNKADASAVTADISAAVSGKAESSDVTTLSGTVATHTSQLGGLYLVKMTQDEYDALGAKDPNTLYVIVD